MADATWQPLHRERTYEQLMAQIEEQLRSGSLHADDRLPSERALAEALGISRPSLRETLRVLEALGIVEVRRGAEGGAFLRGDAGDAFARLLTMQVALGQFSTHDILRTRVALESWSCAEAARHASADDHAALTGILDAMDAVVADETSSSAEFNRLDATFHTRIAQSAGNALTTHLMQSLRTAIEHQMVAAYARLTDWRLTVVIVRREHREILAAIERHDPDAAARLVEEHITSFYSTHGVGVPD